MKKVIVIIIFLISFYYTATNATNKYLSESIHQYSYNLMLKETVINKFEEVINLIKLHEGFRSTPYDDCGYLAIGYGQRLAFFTTFKIGNYVTEETADNILRISFDNHLKLVDYYFPGLNQFQRFSVAHMSYSIGLGNVIKYKYLYKEEGCWKINQHKLYTTRKVDRINSKYRENRIFEYNLFNFKINMHKNG